MEWISVEDELPKEEGGGYLIVNNDNEVAEAEYWGNGVFFQYGWGHTTKPTHWQVLPKPPKE